MTLPHSVCAVAYFLKSDYLAGSDKVPGLVITCPLYVFER